jgi:hypothetical protein
MYHDSIEAVVIAADNAAELESARMDALIEDTMAGIDFINVMRPREDMYHHACAILTSIPKISTIVLN